ncbi:MAG: hypothetical protein ACRDRM_09730 [Pseudonocardiaceae bacterium]
MARAIAVLARAAQDAIWRRTKAAQELRALLHEYYPNFLVPGAEHRAELPPERTAAHLDAGEQVGPQSPPPSRVPPPR